MLINVMHIKTNKHTCNQERNQGRGAKGTEAPPLSQVKFEKKDTKFNF